MLSFRNFHLLEFFKQYEESILPLQTVLGAYFKNHRAIGSKDRQFIKDHVYDLIRNRGLLDYLLSKKDLDPSWANRLKEFLDPAFRGEQENREYPEFVRLGFSEDLYNTLKKEYGTEGMQDFFSVSTQEGPLTIRVNPEKISRELLMDSWKNTYDCELCEHTPFGIRFTKKYSLNHLPEFKKGFFEIQDESCQQAVFDIPLSQEDKVLDYCAGAGGKSLALAHLVKTVYAFDVRNIALKEAIKRFQRARVTNYKVFFSLKELRNCGSLMDTVIVDVPCSGTGTFRRSPEKMWDFNLREVDKLVKLQREIVKKALTFLKPNGRLVYMTCSVLSEENERQVAFFEEEYQLKIVKPILKIWPSERKGDGFFSVCLQKSS